MAKPVNNNQSLINTLGPQRQEKTDAASRLKNKREAESATQAKDSAVAENYGLNVSPKAKELSEARQKALGIARNTPDVREDRVAELKKKINSGSYKVDPDKIADGMMKEALKDQVALDMHDEAKQRV
jgi:negative regulator of flagellin synthesis FlgM